MNRYLYNTSFFGRGMECKIEVTLRFKEPLKTNRKKCDVNDKVVLRTPDNN